MFNSANEFSLHIESIVKEKRISHMDAVLWFCHENLLEPADIASMINKSLKEKIHMNATELNFFPKQGSLDV
jgi:hypothetical protein